MSNTEKKREIPDAPVPAPVPVSLLSSVAPPVGLPNFITTPIPQSQLPPAPQSQLPPMDQPVPSAAQPNLTMQPAESFSPVIPLSKGEPTLSMRSPDDSQATTQSPVSMDESTSDMENLGDIMPGSGILTWMKGAVQTGGILHRVAEKAKSSVDSMITTLDPQMKEYLNSGGDVYVIVASDKEVKISPVREAFQATFGKARVVGYPAQSEVTAAQPVGYSAAYAAAKQRIAYTRASHPDINNNIPVVAIESYLLEALSDRWYDVSLMVLSQPSLGIELQLQSQGTPVPQAAVAASQAATAKDSAHSDTGYDVTIGAIMADSLQVPHTQWQEATTGVSRRDLLLLAAKSIAGSYKKLLSVSAAES